MTLLNIFVFIWYRIRLTRACKKLKRISSGMKQYQSDHHYLNKKINECAAISTVIYDCCLKMVEIYPGFNPTKILRKTFEIAELLGLLQRAIHDEYPQHYPPAPEN